MEILNKDIKEYMYLRCQYMVEFYFFNMIFKIETVLITIGKKLCVSYIKIFLNELRM